MNSKICNKCYVDKPSKDFSPKAYCCKNCRNSAQRNTRTRYPGFESLYYAIQRCYNTQCKDYPNYGGRGIIVCKRWLPEGFGGYPNSIIRFLDDIGIKPSSGYSLDRINNDDHYYPFNCKWSTRKEQANNRRKRRLKL